MAEPAPTASLIIIGNEILSGRTQDTNTQHIAEKLTGRGIKLREVRVIPDQKDIIIATLGEMCKATTYVFTTGGIGPTHDDITAESVAEAFGVPNLLNEEARQMLIAHYGSESELNDARLKMATVPQGAKLIRNPVSGAPGFIIGNVYTMAGVPRIMQSMLDDVLALLSPGPKIFSANVSCTLGESQIAKPLEEIQTKYKNVEIGSYPHYRAGLLGLSLVLRSTDRDLLEKAACDVATAILSLGGQPGAVIISE